MPLSCQLKKEDMDLSVSMKLADNMCSRFTVEEFKTINSDVENNVSH